MNKYNIITGKDFMSRFVGSVFSNILRKLDLNLGEYTTSDLKMIESLLGDSVIITNSYNKYIDESVHKFLGPENKFYLVSRFNSVGNLDIVSNQNNNLLSATSDLFTSLKLWTIYDSEKTKGKDFILNTIKRLEDLADGVNAFLVWDTDNKNFSDIEKFYDFYNMTHNILPEDIDTSKISLTTGNEQALKGYRGYKSGIVNETVAFLTNKKYWLAKNGIIPVDNKYPEFISAISNTYWKASPENVEPLLFYKTDGTKYMIQLRTTNGVNAKDTLDNILACSNYNKEIVYSGGNAGASFAKIYLNSNKVFIKNLNL